MESKMTTVYLRSATNETYSSQAFNYLALQENLWVKTYQSCINEDSFRRNDG